MGRGPGGEVGIAAVLLAAGRSRRLGRPKQLVEFRGEPLVRRVARAALDAGLSPVVVVIAPGADEVRRAVGDPAMACAPAGASGGSSPALNAGCVVVENPQAGTGMASTVRAGVAHVRTVAPGVDAVVLMTCDQPLLDAAHLRRLVEARRGTRRPIVASEYGGTRGVPVLMGAEVLEELTALEGDRGARDLVRRDPARVASVPFPGGELDIDDADDLAALSARDREPHRE